MRRLTYDYRAAPDRPLSAKSGHTGLKQRAGFKPTSKYYAIATSTLFLLHLERTGVLAQPYPDVAKISSVGDGMDRICILASTARSRR
jgi:hypothetical protein